MSDIKILSIGQFGAYGISNTCLHRNWALEKLGNVTKVDTTVSRSSLYLKIANRLYVKFHIPLRFTNHKANKEIVKLCQDNSYDLIWIDKGIYINPSTIKQIRYLLPTAKIVEYSPDNMVERHNQTKNFVDCLPYIDYFVTTKSYIVEGLKRLGVKNVIFVNNAYEDTFHHPYDISEEEKQRLGGKVGFIGAWEKERCESIMFLAAHGIPVRVWGGGKWIEYKDKYPCLKIEDKGLFSDDYNKALSAFDISLCFLRKINFDQQTTRTMEIPACKSLLMAERTKEHEILFEDTKEAVFFSNNDELLEKCTYYLKHTDELEHIREAGYKRCLTSGYSNLETIRRVLKEIGI